MEYWVISKSFKGNKSETTCTYPMFHENELVSKEALIEINLGTVSKTEGVKKVFMNNIEII